MHGDNLINQSDTYPTFVSRSRQRGCQKGMHDTSIILRYVMSFSRTAMSGSGMIHDNDYYHCY